MPAFVQTAKRLVRQAVEDNITGEAAKVAYYAFLSLFPLILTVFALTGLLGGDAAFRWIMEQLRAALPPETAEYLGVFVQQVTGQPRPGLLSFGVLGLLWAASGIFAALADGLNAMYNVRETRGFVRKRLLALGMLFVGSVLLIVAAASLVAGPELIELLGLGFAWNLLRWPLSFVPVVLLLWLLYYVLPARDQSGCHRETFVGALLGTLLWLGVSALFRLYVTNFSSYAATYGAVGAVMVLLLWLNLTALAILSGGEVAAVLEQRERPT